MIHAFVECIAGSCASVTLMYLEKDLHFGVLLKPCEHPRQYGEQAGAVCQSPGGCGRREDQAADGREEEGG